MAILVYDVWATYRANRRLFNNQIKPHDHYEFKQVVVLNVLYFATFGSELAVVSMLPLFFADTFSLPMVQAGLLASVYAFMNLMSRPGGGWLSDRFGRKKTLLVLTAGLALGYATMSVIDATWPIYLAVIATMACSFFVQAGEGAVFSIVPLIKRRLTGQIAGLTGAYGNVGAVFYLTMLTSLSYAEFFMLMSATAVLGLVTLTWLREPKGHMIETAEDGSVVMIKVSE
jgi:NNP family nitrate/nitrite transporter-like MFS transporter